MRSPRTCRAQRQLLHLGVACAKWLVEVMLTVQQMHPLFISKISSSVSNFCLTSASSMPTCKEVGTGRSDGPVGIGQKTCCSGRTRLDKVGKLEAKCKMQLHHGQQHILIPLLLDITAILLVRIITTEFGIQTSPNSFSMTATFSPWFLVRMWLTAVQRWVRALHRGQADKVHCGWDFGCGWGHKQGTVRQFHLPPGKTQTGGYGGRERT